MILIYNCQCLMQMRRIYLLDEEILPVWRVFPSKGIFTERKIRNDANGTADG